MIRVYAIIAHPRKNSLIGNFFYSAVKHMQLNGAIVDVLDLYDHLEKIPFYRSSKDLIENQFYLENKERFMAADRIFIAYPIYWYAVPGIMKCWLDLITNYAFSYDHQKTDILHNYAKPLHKITKAFVINTASMSNWFRWLRTKNSGSEMIKESLNFFAINRYSFYEVGNAEKLTNQQIMSHTKNIINKADWLIKGT